MKNSIPIIHSSVALLKICDFDYNTIVAMFMKIFIEKKYALHEKVTNALI